MPITYEDYISYKVRSATMDEEIEGRKAQIVAENVAKKMEANLHISMYAEDSLSSIPKLMKQAGYEEATIQATLKEHSRQALADMGIKVIEPPASPKPGESG